MASDLIFYTNPMSRGRIVRWMLEESGADYETVVVDYGPTMKAEPFRSINPMGKVPAIVHHGQAVTECAGICAYLADVFPDAGLGPREGEKAAYYRWLFFAAGPVEQAVTNTTAGFVPTPERTRMFGYGSLDLTLDVVEQAITRTPYVAGERFTAADVYLGSQLGWGLRFGTIPHRDTFAAYVERLTARDAYRRAGEKDDALAPMPS